MKPFSSLKQQAIAFLEQFKTKEPATYAAAEQAIGAVLIADGLFGIDNPMSQKKRPGIFGTLSGVIVGIIFILIPGFFGAVTNSKNMTETVPAVVVSVGETFRSPNSKGGGACPLVVRYTVNGQEYSGQSSILSSSNCALTAGQSITINYDPANPASWAYGAETMNVFLGIFFWIGILLIVSSAVTFFIRLISIIFGWKLLKDGRKNAAALPPGSNIGTIINEIKQSFVSSVFSFGGAQGAVMSAITQNAFPPAAPKPTDSV
jgi:hypothetical protein